MDAKVITMTKIERKRVKQTFGNFLSVGWLTPLMMRGGRKTLEAQDLLDLKESDLASNASKMMDPFWNQLKKHQADPAQPAPRLFSIVFSNFGWRFLIALLLQACSVACLLATPTFLKEIIIYLQLYANPTPNFPGKPTLLIQSGVGIAFVLFGLQLAGSIFRQTALQVLNEIQINVNTIMIGAVYEKALRLSQKSSREFSQGKILNIVNVDVDKITIWLPQGTGFFCAPIQLGVAIKLIYDLIGIAVWGGAGSLFGILILQISIIGFLVKFQKGFLAAGDKRLKALREVLYGIKIIKFRAMEQFFINSISKIRDEQLSFLKRFYFIQVYFIGLIQIAPISMPVVGFIVYGLLNDGNISPAIIFPALSLFQGLFQTILVIPQGLIALVVANVSFKRVAAFLAAEEDPGIAKKTATDDSKLIFKSAQYKWDTPPPAVVVPVKKSFFAKPEVKEAVTEPAEKVSDAFQLNDLNIKIRSGAKIGIVGPVGSGKSSLLSAIIGEMPKLSGEADVFGSIAYCTQQPWILTETVQGNIVFNKDVDEAKLNAILQAVGLDNDLKSFPTGRFTGIGEKGVNLSGGQKARVALARAMYQESDILLLDDPLSALDSQVGKVVFERGIMRYLKAKTVLLVTHQLHLLPELDYIIVFEKGRIKEQGSYEELTHQKGLLFEMMKNYSVDKKGEEKEAAANDAVEKDDDGKGGIIAAEDQEQGSVKGDVFWMYISACGGWAYIIPLFVAALLNAGFNVFSNIWLSYWTSDKLGLAQFTYLQWYGILGVAQFFFALSLNTIFLAGGYRASKYFHKAALTRLMKAPMGFFDSQPIGRILNRMSKDIESVDQQIWLFAFLCTISSAGLIGTGAILIYTNAYMAALTVPLLAFYFVMLVWFQRSNREFKRFESTNRSPLYSHISETLSGISTVKAYGVENEFVGRQRMLMDNANVPFNLKLHASIWIGIRMEILGTSLTLLLALLGVSSAIDPSSIGVALTFALGLTGLLNLLLLSSSALETEFNSVERLSYYCNGIPQEGDAVNEGDPDEKSWPEDGTITFDNITMSYPSRPDVDILKGITLDVKTGEKIGVVGRTGSGKSTLMTALFRIVDLKAGKILISGKDISTLGLSTLRSRLQIIPQEPVLFKGTIRMNLDLEAKYPDTDVWDVLDRIGLKPYVSGLNDKLESQVTENGENLSVGQRQLICLGRAMLTKPSILVMDEATASVDAEADLLIQKSIKTHFSQTTVLSIAHRLNTIADFDRVLVLSDGVKIEYDSPNSLLANPKGLFSQLADATGPSNSALIRSIAFKKSEIKA